MRQTVAVANTSTSVVLNVTGSSANLSWNGPANGAWDVKTSNNWTGTGGPQFNQLDNVTFGNVANKTLTVNANVAPGSVTFNGGAGSTYTVTGSGGMTGFGPVSVTSGTVQLQNTGNAYAGTTTVAAGAVLEIGTAKTGSMVVNGTLSIGGAGVTEGGARTFYSDNFSGAGGPLSGTTPSTSFDGSHWVAAPTFHDDGKSVTGPAVGASATLAFQPANGSTYVLTTSLTNIVGASADWMAAGFAHGQSDASSNNSRFVSGDVQGLAWALYRGATSNNETFLGNSSLATNGGTASEASWLVDSTVGGGNVGLRFTLDTTGGSGHWNVTMEADTGSGFHVIRAAQPLLDESITSVGVVNRSTATMTGTVTAFSLTGTEPANARLVGKTLTVDGDLTMGTNSTLKFDIADIGRDFVDVTGAATLDGTIDVTKLGSFTPAAGTTYTILSAAAGITNLGVDFNLPAGFQASIVDLTDLVLTYGLQGDFNGNGVVDAADYVVWRTGLGTTYTQADYDVWRAHFGQTAGSGSGASAFGAGQQAVPEPATWVLVLLASFAGLALRRSATCDR